MSELARHPSAPSNCGGLATFITEPASLLPSMNQAPPLSLRILVGVNEATVALEIEACIRAMGHLVIGPANTGELALQLAERDRPDFALVDFNLGAAGDGLETAALLRSRLDVPVLFLTTTTDDTFLERSLSTSPLGYLVRPFSKTELHAAIKLSIHRLAFDRQRHQHVRQLEARLTERTAALEEEVPRLSQEDERHRSAGLPPDNTSPRDVQKTGQVEHWQLDLVAGRRQAEKVAQNSLELLQSVVENAPVRVFWKDKDLRYLGCNSWFARDAGFTSPAEIVGKTDFEMGWKAQAEAYRADDRAVMEGGVTKLGYEEPQTTPSGNLIWLRTSKVPLHGEGGQITGILGIYDDITARKQAEQALRESEQRFRRLFEDSADAILLFENDRFIDCNAAALAMLQMTDLSQIRGAPPRALSPEFQPDGRRSEEKAVEVIAEAFEKGSNLFEWVHVRSNGEPFTAEVLLTPIQDPNRRLLHVVWRDITERKRAENELRETHDRLATLFEGARDAIFIADEQSGLILDANAAACDLLALTRDKILGRCLADLHPPDKAAFYLEQMRELATRGIRVVEAEVLRSDGRPIPVEITAGVGTLATGRRVIQGFFRDVTERKQLQSQMMRRQRLESIGTLAGGVAHDLNNALAPILLVTEMLRSQYPDENEMIGIVATSTRRATEMVKQLLTFARGVEGERQNLQTIHLLREMEKIIKSTFPKNIQLRTTYTKELRTVLGDATQLHQVLLNLCVNARDAMPLGGTLTLEAENQVVDQTTAAKMTDANPGPHVVWRIKDTGIGIPAENLDRIFDPFFTTKAPEMGTGLGLSTALGIVRSHGGFLQVRSTPNQGTTFAVYLPTAAPTDSSVPASDPQSLYRGNGEMILLVDDEASVRLAAQNVLQRLNFTPLIASDGLEGLARAAEHAKDLRAVITDQHMPHMDGLNFVRVLRRFLPDVPVAVASGRLEPASVEEYHSLGVRMRLDKPFSEPDLAQLLSRLLGRGASPTGV
ncbi:MAG: PAS domain S-box protein [Verrucomicrobiales bacterium]|nr:PAS domain S-box protein [Verrucomicrobiales bacterium]